MRVVAFRKRLYSYNKRKDVNVKQHNIYEILLDHTVSEYQFMECLRTKRNIKCPMIPKKVMQADKHLQRKQGSRKW